MTKTGVNEIIFSKDKYGNNREKMFEAIAKQLALLMENDYVCKVYDDDRDIIVIQFMEDQRREWMGLPELMWLTDDEVEVIEAYREDKKNES